MTAQQRARAIADAVAARDLPRLGTHLTDDVRLRALLPGGLVEVAGRDETLSNFDGWFRDYSSIRLKDVRGEEVGDRLLVHYRLAFPGDDGPKILTQTLIATLDRDDPARLARIDLVCSGFRDQPALVTDSFRPCQ